MTALEAGDIAVITGPLVLPGHHDQEGFVYLQAGEVVEIIEPDDDGSAYVYGRSSDVKQYIDKTSLTSFSELAEDPEIDWDSDEAYVRLSGTHDYVYEGDDE